MEIYSDLVENKRTIESSIKKYGYSPEHNYYHFTYQEDEKNKCVYFDFGKNRGVLARLELDTNIWTMLSEVLAPEKERINIFKGFLDYVFNIKAAKKVIVEVGTEFRNHIIKNIGGSKYKVCRTNYCLYWPVYDVKTLNPKLPGKKWKKIRNIKNRFNKNFKISLRNAKKTKNNLLTNVLNSWIKKRPHDDEVDISYYKKAIENHFQGFDVAKSIFINGEPCSISGGWTIPNSEDIYYGIGIQNYKYHNINELANLQDLMTAKKNGYKNVDLGGSDKTLLYSKKKLKPKKIYKSHVFSILKRN
tara:strand:- start:11947 stop:12855 length:909 start_codon:yes stop_codon:yes gene_type:complete